MISYKARTPADLSPAAKTIVNHMTLLPIVAFHGEMGVGKTTLIKEICLLLDVTVMVNSPSFAIINEYIDARDEPLYHFDLYRVNSPGELAAIGANEYLDNGYRCLIEWPANAGPMLPANRIDVFMSEVADGSRLIRIELVSIQ